MRINWERPIDVLARGARFRLVLIGCAEWRFSSARCWFGGFGGSDFFECVRGLRFGLGGEKGVCTDGLGNFFGVTAYIDRYERL